MLSSLDLADRRRVPGLQPERADIILAGVEIVLAVMEGLAVNRLVVSERYINGTYPGRSRKKVNIYYQR